MEDKLTQLGIKYSGEFYFSLFHYSQNQISEFEFAIQKIVNILHSNETGDEQREVLNQLWNILVSNLPLPAINSDVNFIVRARPNDEGQIFEEEADVSYNSKNRSAITENRFNMAGESVFYGAFPSDKQERFVAAVSIESFKELLSDLNTKDVFYYTFSKWAVLEKFTIINLCFEQTAYKEHPGLQRIINNTHKELQDNLPAPSFGIIVKFWNFISALSGFRKINDQHYRITTAFFHTLRNFYESSGRGIVNGLIYPSPMVYGQAINVVLIPHAVDRYLKLQEVFMFKYIRDSNDPKVFDTEICSLPKIPQNGILNISGIKWGRETGGYTF